MAEVRPHRWRRWRHGPSLFFPVALMTVGIIWLLVNYGLAEPENVYRLMVFWPVLLVAAGLAAILRPISWVLSGLVWLALGALVVWSVVYPPTHLPGYTAPQYTHRVFNEPLNDAQTAAIQLDLSFNPVEVKAYDDGLFFADVYAVGSLHYNVSGGGAQKNIRLGEEVSGVLFNLPAVAYESRAQIWQVGLSPRIPLELDIQGGLGSANVDLSALQLESLNVDGGLGKINLELPEDSALYKFRLDVGAGDVTVQAPSGATFDLDLYGGVGSVDLILPADSGVQVTVRNEGLGRLDLPEGYRKVRQGKDENEGVWQNEAFEDDETPIRITVDISVGNITIR